VVVHTNASEEKKWAGEGAGLGEEEETVSEKFPAVQQKAEQDTFIGRFYIYLYNVLVINPHAPTSLLCVCTCVSGDEKA